MPLLFKKRFSQSFHDQINGYNLLNMSGKKTKNVKASIKQLLVTSTIKVKFGLNKII